MENVDGTIHTLNLHSMQLNETHETAVPHTFDNYKKPVEHFTGLKK
jgi:hypothetical protein